jgi:copper homeostasis protein
VAVTAAANAPVAVEVAIDSVAGARAAAKAGAARVELCQALELGGLTPSRGLLAAVVAAVRIPVFAIVRPRPGDFLYSRDEFAVMLRDAQELRAAGADGLVGGALRADGELDRERMRELRAAAGDAPFTCHRAFDLAADAARALDALIELGVPRVLTSGQAANAPAGAGALRALVQRAAGRIAVMAGAGVRDDNVKALVAASGVRDVHLSASARTASAMVFRRAGVPMGSAAPDDEYSTRVTDGAMVARVVEALRGV